MSERGSFRGGRGRGGRQQQKDRGNTQEKPKKENILDLNKYMDKEVQVKFNGGREGGLRVAFRLASDTDSASFRYPQGLRPTHEPRP